MRFGITLDDVFLRHATPPGHPERPDRIRALSQRIRQWEGYSELVEVEPVSANEDWLRAVHSAELVAQVARTEGNDYSQLDPDTHAGPESHRTALLAAGSAVELTRRLLHGVIDSGFALVRPPGHHAESNRPMGFCLFNNIAVAAQWALSQGGLERVAVVDFDVHHGNGTQEIFEQRGDLLFVSTHQHPLYPGTGHLREQGSGPGAGSTFNFPLPAGMGNSFYISLFEDFVTPILRWWRPQLILVSAGYDAHRMDPLANMRLDAAGFAALSSLLCRAARELCQGRILFLLEGGYHLEALCEGVIATIEAVFDPSRHLLDGTETREYRLYRDEAAEALSTIEGLALGRAQAD